MSLREEQCKKVCRILDDVLANRPTERDSLILAVRKAFVKAFAEPKRGKWIYHPEIGWGETWLCDQCGEKTTSTVMGKPRANFCPNCGADMREETT